jgi:protein-S-isoprenylcysteine O-methyltransferase Ste14
MMLYMAFACVVNHWIAYSIVIWAYCSIFAARIFQKEMSLRRKKGWEVYAQHSWPLLPKINGRTSDSLIFYSLAVALSTLIYLNV